MNRFQLGLYGTEILENMRNYSLFLFASLLVSQLTFGQINPNQRKIQVAILFDASNSMDGLLNQAKSRMWNIVNELSTYRYNGEQPQIEFALFQYGKDDLLKSQNYIEKLLNFSTDLDLVSAKLFGITTNGGSEYCGAVIKDAHKTLEWSQSTNDLKMIYIAGNEPFNQGNVSFREVIPECLKDEIFVNTIYCGNREAGIREFWRDGAELGGGSFFHINSNEQIRHIDTPYDAQIRQYNDSLNSTYVGYGRMGREKKALQTSEDRNAASFGWANSAERSVAKSKSNMYLNYSWDIVDGLDQDVISLDSMKKEDLPEEMKNMTLEEKKAYVDSLATNRKRFQQNIQQLGEKRAVFIAEEQKKNPNGSEESDFGKSVNKSIAEKATKIGFQKESN